MQSLQVLLHDKTLLLSPRLRRLYHHLRFLELQHQDKAPRQINTHFSAIFDLPGWLCCPQGLGYFLLARLLLLLSAPNAMFCVVLFIAHEH